MNRWTWSAASRMAAVLGALSGLGALVWSGCGSNDGRYYCDANGCYSCDGYGCTNVNPPTPQSCTGDSSCPAGSVCTTSGCEQTCNASSDCAHGTVCKGGLCVPPAQDGGGAPHQCSAGADCGAGKACIGNTCQACGGSNPACPCNATTDCQSGEVCVANKCT